MNILYGLSGVGYGHSSRAKVIAKHLEKKGHKILFMTFGKGYEVLKNYFNVKYMQGLDIIFDETGVVKKKKTINYNLKNFSKNIYKLNEINKLVKEFAPQLCITDMDPIITYISHYYRIPLISIDNQNLLSKCKLNLDLTYKEKFDMFITKRIIKSFTRGAKEYIITSFIKPKKKKYNATLIPPILRDEVKKYKEKKGEKNLVYFSSKNPETLEILKSINQKFIVFGYNINKKENNIEFKKFDSLLPELAKAKAVISTAGFSLISECIYFNKPILTIPLKGQFEQLLNSILIKKAGFGNYSENLEKSVIEDFLKKTSTYQKNLKNYKPDLKTVFNKIDKIINEFN